MEAPDRPAHRRWWLVIASVCALLSLVFLTRATVTPVTALSSGPDFDCGSSLTNVLNGRPPSTEGAHDGLLEQCRVVSRKRFFGYGAMGLTSALVSIGIVVIVAVGQRARKRDPSGPALT
jgi:hypothetical protein